MIKLFKKSIPDVSFLETKKTWEELEALQQGYSNEKILEKYKHVFADMQIKPSTQLTYPSITNIASFAYKNNKKAKVVDFGGGIGNFYYQIKELFPDLQLDWTIIEQKYIVHFCNTKDVPIKYKTLDQYLNLENSGCDILLLSGVLQYIKYYQSLLNTLIIDLEPEEIIIDRTFFRYKGDRKLILQYINKDISYPAYIFNKDELYQDHIMKTRLKYKLFNEWSAPMQQLFNSRVKYYTGGAVFKKT